MKLLNFHVAETSTVVVGNVGVDLHNDYDFVGVSYEEGRSVLTLGWIRGDGSWVRPTLPTRLRLLFHGPSFFRLLPPPDDGAQGGRTLSFMGFLHPDQLDVMDGFVDEKDAADDFHMIFGFEDESAIKVFSERVEAEVVVS